MEQDPLHVIKEDKWNGIKKVFESDFPRGITGYNVLQTQKLWLEQGIDFGFKVLCPFGDAKNGMVAVCQDNITSQTFIECPSNDTKNLEEALKNTKLLKWDQVDDVVVLFPPGHVVECIKKIAKEINLDIKNISHLYFYLLDKDTSPFEVSLPSDLVFKPLTPEYIELIDSNWPHRYPGSTSYFDLLIKAKSGFGLFKNDELISWGFINKTGALGHIYTLEEHRRKGFGELVTKLICNELLRQGRHVNSYCSKTNLPSCKMHEKLGFKMVGEVFTVYMIRNKDKSQ